MCKAVLFDLDQTLLDRNTSLKSFLNWQVNDLQLIYQAQKEIFIQRFIELDANGSVWKDLVYRQLIDEFKIVQYSEQQLLESYIQDFNKFCVAFDGVGETIVKLHQDGFKLALISNGKTPFQEHNFQASGLSEYFSSIIVSDAAGLRKPQVEIFDLACQQLDVLPEQCVFVGDNEIADIQGAKNAGMKTIFFDSEQKQIFTEANHCVQYFQEILTVLNIK